jgi:putative aminopeptidase FrvX
MDTLGQMVKSITDDGRLTIHKLGGGGWTAIEGENCTIHTRAGKTYRGSIIPKDASVHIHGLKAYEKREQEDMRVRIDEKVSSKDEVKELGISVGDIVTMDTRTEFTENGFIKTRYIDNKSAVAIAMILAKRFKEEKPKQTVYFIFSNYEEVGHGVTTLPQDIEELIAIDIGTVGYEQTSTEYAVSICAKDNKSPYDYDFVTRLVNTCEEHDVPYNVDVFNHYGSDATQVIMTGGDVRFACVGPGVEATHHYERTHMEAIEATTDLLYYYLK